MKFPLKSWLPGGGEDIWANIPVSTLVGLGRRHPTF
jgi:hypothetical protein